MTSNETESTPVAAEEGIQQIPAEITVTEVPAETEARDALLAAIGREAQIVADKSAGQASAALGELGRAYAVTTSANCIGLTGLNADVNAGSQLVLHAMREPLFAERGTPAALFSGGGKAVMWTGEEVSLWGAQDYARTLANTATDLSTPEDTERPPTAVGVSEGTQQIPAQTTVTEVPAAIEARDVLLAAIGREAQIVADKSAGQASAALVELARAYALLLGRQTDILDDVSQWTSVQDFGGVTGSIGHNLDRLEGTSA
ncbi:hypothetical protein ACWGNM_31615 [Streptomyces sp. NPDC055796]